MASRAEVTLLRSAARLGSARARSWRIQTDGEGGGERRHRPPDREPQMSGGGDGRAVRGGYRAEYLRRSISTPYAAPRCCDRTDPPEGYPLPPPPFQARAVSPSGAGPGLQPVAQLHRSSRSRDPTRSLSFPGVFFLASR